MHWLNLRVALSLRGERGLKHGKRGCHRVSSCVALSLRGERGLKQRRRTRRSTAPHVALSLRGERGLKRRYGRFCFPVCPGSAPPSGRARIETGQVRLICFTSGVALSLRGERGLKPAHDNGQWFAQYVALSLRGERGLKRFSARPKRFLHW